MKPAPDYSKEGFVITSFAKDVTFAEDGTSTVEQSAAIRIQSDAGVRQFGVLGFDYESDIQKIEVVYVRVRKPDGSVVSTPAESTQDISSDVARIAPTYSDLRQKQIPVKGLSAGDTLEYKIRFICFKTEIPGEFWYAQSFIRGAVVLQETLQISTPAAKYVKVVSPALKPEIRVEAGRRIFLWKTEQLDPSSKQQEKLKSEPSSPPAVQLTTFQNWNEVGAWFGQLQESSVVVSPAIQAKAAELTKGLTTAADKEKAIYQYVSTQLRYISVSFGIGRYQPHAAGDVLANQYGDCKDKHTLFAALLKAVGIEAWPALIGSDVKFDPDVPSPVQFNHVITVLPKQNGYVWLDTTPEVAPFGLLSPQLRDQKALVIPSKGAAVLVTTPAAPPFAVSQVVRVDATLKPDGTLNAHFDITVRGDDEMILRAAFHEVPAVQWQDLAQAQVRALGFLGTVSNVEADSPDRLEKPFHYSFDYVRQNYSDWANRRIIPPLFPMLLPSGGENDEKPADAIEMGAPGEITYHATVHLPKNLSATLPVNTTAQTAFGNYVSSYAAADTVLTAERHLVVKVSKVPVSAWDQYSKFAKQVRDDQNQHIQLTDATAKADAALTPGNGEASRLIQDAMQALHDQDFDSADDELARADRLNPTERDLWLAHALWHFLDNQPQAAFTDLAKEIANHPDNARAYKLLAQSHYRYRQNDEAIQALQQLMKLEPNDFTSASLLSHLLIAAKRYKEVPDVARKALGNDPDNKILQTELAEALLHDGEKDEGIAMAQKIAADQTDGSRLNAAARVLAETATDLPLAKAYGEKSVELLDDAMKTLTIANVTDQDLHDVTQLAETWDTVGWIHFEMGDMPTAEKYVEAAWRLGQEGAIADHLGQIYAREGRQEQAIRSWQLALAADPALGDTRERLKRAGADDGTHPRLIRGAKHYVFVSPGEELGKLRTTGIPELPKQQGTAEFFVLFAGGKPENAQFISGADSLKPATDALKRAHYDFPWPDGGPEKIIRRGILSCSGYTTPSCQFVMLVPASTRR